VYFDDMLITHKSDLSVIQADDYFPFGLTMAGTSYKQSGAQENNYLYNGKELQDELDLDLYHYGARFYDPALARFTTIDPKAESYALQSGYVYAANNPVIFQEKNGENPILGTLRFLGTKITRYASKRAVKAARKKSLKRAQKSLQKNVDDHVKKLDEFKKDPFGKTDPKKLQEMKGDNPTKEILEQRLKKSRINPLEQQIKKNQGELNKVNQQLKELNKGSEQLKQGTAAVVGTATAKKTVDAVTPDIDTTVSGIKQAVGVVSGQPSSEEVANLGTTILGDNKVGRFVDEWINPFGIVDDIQTLIIIGVISATTENEE
jgi:RHS repeat-associated protein